MQFRMNLPPLTRALLAILLIVSLANFAIGRFITGHHNDFALVPQLTIFYPWLYITATFAERIYLLPIAAVTILYGGKYFERAWGSQEFAKFFLLVTLLPNVAATVWFVVYYAVTRNYENAFASIQGSSAIQGAFLVAFKQLVPEHTVTLLQGILRIRVKHFPAIFLLAHTLSGILVGTDTQFVLAWAGFFTSWIYLRFYKSQSDLLGTGTGESAKIKGDASETFAFAYFWPDVVQPPIAAMANGIYNTLVALSILKPFSQEEVESSNSQATARGEGGLPSLLHPTAQGGRGGKREEAERRRALALKALDQRLHDATTNRAPISSAPTVPVATSQPKNPEDDAESAAAA